MASFSTSNSNGRFTLTLNISERSITSDMIANNYSIVDYSLVLTANTSYHFAIYPIGRSVTLNGSVVYSIARGSSGNFDLNGYSSITLASGASTIYHDSDGSKNIGVAYSIDMADYSYTAGAISGSSSMWLTTIPRASSISSLTSSCDVNGSNSLSISISRNSSAFTHNLTWSFGSYSSTQTGIGTSTTFTPPTSWLNAIPNSTSGTGAVTMTTMNGGTQVGSSVVKYFTLTVPSAYVPTISSVTSDIVNNTVPSAWGIYVKGKSQCKLTVNSFTGSYGSTLSSYSITGTGLSYSGKTNNTTTSILNTSGTLTFTAKAVDSRGRVSATKTCSITVYDYSSPNINSVLSQRCTSGGTLSDSGTYVKILGSFSYSSCNGKNTISAKVYFRVNGGTYDSGAPFSSNTSKVIGGGAISTDKSYEIKYEVTDAFNKTVSYTDVVTTSFFTMDILSGGKGVAIGKAAETANQFDVGMDTRFRGTVSIDGSLPINSGGTGATTASGARSNLGITYANIGTVPVANGGTGGTNSSALFNALSTGTSNPQDADYYITQYAGGGTTTTTYHRRPHSALWNYIRGKFGDFVVDEGKTGYWYYRKWNSGKAECWGTSSHVVNITSAWGSIYDSGGSGVFMNFPTGFFNATPVCVLTPYTTGGSVVIQSEAGISTTRTQTFWFCRGTSMSNVSVYVNYYAYGTWK